MSEFFGVGLRKEYPKNDGPQRRAGHIDVPESAVKEAKVEADPYVEYDKILKKTLLDFGNEILELHKNSPIPGNLIDMLKNYSTKQLVDEIKDTKMENWKISGVMFKALVEEINLRLWEIRNKSRLSKGKGASIVRLK
ncbi:MAG: hypothetical protein KBC69_02080 [Candidatus Magasanikbacteria bacterium]|nr:hypothetical protein [Candidatus Magasanikbacteria bacterium]